MEKQMDYLEAWEDFYAWVNQPEQWANIDRPGRDRIAKAQKRHTDKTPTPLGFVGVMSLLNEYASERYRFVVILDK